MSSIDWDNPEEIENVKNTHDLYLSTGQVSKFILLFEVIKDIILKDINIIMERDFIYVIHQHSQGISMVHLKLETKFFEFYHINQDKIVVGIDPKIFVKIIKTAKNNDNTISLCINSKKKDSLIIRIEDENSTCLSEDTIKFRKFEEEVINIPSEIEYPGSIIVPSSRIKHIFKTIKTKSPKRNNKRIEITHVNDYLEFKYKGENSDQKVVLSNSKILKNADEIYYNSTEDTLSQVMKEKSKENENMDIIHGVYDIEYLIIFAKATNLNSHLLIRMKNDMPLIFEYKVGVLGTFHLLLNSIE